MSLAQNLFESNTTSTSDVLVLPPMLRQYLEYKEQYPDCILLFQVGDFYEAFFEDAKVLAKTINLTLTSRDKSSANPIPMAGVPISAIEGYASRLVQAGLSVAIVSQQTVEEGFKGAVPRKLERIITPGISVSSAVVDTTHSAIVAVLSFDSGWCQSAGVQSDYSIAYADVTTGRILLRLGTGLESLIKDLSNLAPAELIFPQAIDNQRIDRRMSWFKRLETLLFETTIKFRNLGMLVVTSDSRRFTSIQGYSSLAPLARNAVRLFIQYVDETTVNNNLPFQSVELVTSENCSIIDATTRRNLDLVKNSKDGSSNGTLLSAINRTVTGSGLKLLRQWILAPSISIDVLEQRYNAVQKFMNSVRQCSRLQELLNLTADLERISARIELGLVNPHELGAVRDTLFQLPEINNLLNEITFDDQSIIRDIIQGLSCPTDILSELSNSLIDQPPLSRKSGQIFKSGFDEELDRLRNLQSSGASLIIELECREKERTKISSLKVRHNNVHGYYIEITKANLDKTPEDYIRKQTTSNSERFYTPELKQIESELVSADSKLLLREEVLYSDLILKLKAHTSILRGLNAQLALLDVLLSFASLSNAEGLIRPVLDDSYDLHIEEGKHPVLMQILQSRFIPNSLEFNSSKCCAILTGANMGGKSTYLRQTALIVIMAQIGCFVPANSAKIGLVDKIFARLGASDDLLEGESTFMVEMREASHIISSATKKSLLLIDEIGRGTATADGLAIARSILEWIAQRLQSRCLFATHFHELTSMDKISASIFNLSVADHEVDGQVIFTHQIVAGPADSSYGLEVAKLAGLPDELLVRAEELLEEHVKSEQSSSKNRRTAKSLSNSNPNQLSIFESNKQVKVDPEVQKKLKAYGSLTQQISALDVNNLTPLEALNIFHKLKQEYGDA